MVHIPWTPSEIARAREVPLIQLLAHLCDFVKEDREYTPLDASRCSRRFQVNCRHRDFRLVLTGEKWVDELVPRDSDHRGGGGAIDLASYLTKSSFVQAVKLCLEAAEVASERR